jgi:hypothetical protein
MCGRALYHRDVGAPVHKGQAVSCAGVRTDDNGLLAGVILAAGMLRVTHFAP